VLKTSPAGTTSEGKSVGEVLVADSKILIACGAEGQDRLELVSVQPANKGRMSARDWANGVRIHPGDVLVS
jgi:methionyl-tRNA formyltransferase